MSESPPTPTQISLSNKLTGFTSEKKKKYKYVQLSELRNLHCFDIPLKWITKQLRKNNKVNFAALKMEIHYCYYLKLCLLYELDVKHKKAKKVLQPQFVSRKFHMDL